MRNPQREKQQVEEALRDARRNEEEMSQSNQTLLSRLEEVQVKPSCWRPSDGTPRSPPLPFLLFSQSKMARLNQEHRELKEKLKEERRQREELWKTKTQLEDERRLQDRSVEQLQRKVETETGEMTSPALVSLC